MVGQSIGDGLQLVRRHEHEACLVEGGQSRGVRLIQVVILSGRGAGGGDQVLLTLQVPAGLQLLLSQLPRMRERESKTGEGGRGEPEYRAREGRRREREREQSGEFKA